MRKYSEFLLEQQLQLISESIVYISPKLRTVLRSVHHPIAKALLSSEEKEIKDDITFLDYTEQEGFITYKTMRSMLSQIDASTLDDGMKSVLKKVEIDDPQSRLCADHLAEYQKDIYKKSRNPIKLGRLINAVLPGQFDSNQIAKFTDKFKSYQKGEVGKIEVVEGQEIAHWYKAENYLELKSSLGSSCMRNVNSKFFGIYTDNPEVCKMVVILEEDEQGQEKLVARALLWKPSDIINGKGVEFEWFMDRQYATSDAGVESLRKWATDKGYAYKTNNTHSSFSKITYQNEDFSCNMEVQLKKYVYYSFPYMDTFRRLDPDPYILYNDDNEDEEYAGCYILNSTSGGYQEVQENRGVWSEWHDQYLDEDEAVYSEPLDDYLRYNRAVQVTLGSRRHRGWWPQDHDNIVYDGWNHVSIHIDDAVYSEYYDEYILSDESIDIVDWVGKDGNCGTDPCYVHENEQDYLHRDSYKRNFWYEHLSEKRRSNWDIHYGILKSLIVKDWKNKWILKDFQIKLYKVVGEDFAMEYLDTGVFIALDRDDIQLSEEEQTWCVFEYLHQVDINFDLGLVGQKLSDKLSTLTTAQGSMRQDCKKVLDFMNVY